MHASTLLAGGALLLSSTVLATSPEELIPRDDSDFLMPDATVPWVKVDDEGQPSTTISPSMTTEASTTSYVDAAPHDLTASVYTFTSWGEISTSTGNPPNPTATGKDTVGSFSRCYNMDGDYAPFCRPSHNSSLYTGKTYYVTWDPDYYNQTTGNVTYDIAVRLDYLNRTSNEYVKLKDFNRVPASWGFYPLKIDGKYKKGHKSNNVTLTLISTPSGSDLKNNSIALPAVIEDVPFLKNKDTPTPSETDLIIALPTVLGGIALLVIGVCLWNRKTRRIQLGNIMSRTRHGYNGLKTRRRHFFSKNGDAGGAIQLDERPVSPQIPDYSDFEPPQRDSLDGLGSPTDANFQEQGTTGGNAFRNEINRQKAERTADRSSRDRWFFNDFTSRDA